MFLGAGCGAPNSLTADDLKAGTSITVKWSWQGYKTVITPAKYKVWSANSPLPGAVWTQIYGGATGGTATTLDDTIGAAAVRFYKVQAFASDGTPSDTSWPEGGSTSGIPVDNLAPLTKAQLLVWEAAGNCIHKYTELKYPNPGSPPDNFPIDHILPGSALGTLHLYMDLTTVGGLNAVAEFTFANYTDTCTNGVNIWDGWQLGLVDVTNFDGNMYGYSDYGAGGWEEYELVVDNKHAAGGHWYVNDGVRPTAYMSYNMAPWLDCAACTGIHPICLCP
jgi:hypothetical protein